MVRAEDSVSKTSVFKFDHLFYEYYLWSSRTLPRLIIGVGSSRSRKLNYISMICRYTDIKTDRSGNHDGKMWLMEESWNIAQRRGIGKVKYHWNFKKDHNKGVGGWYTIHLLHHNNHTLFLNFETLNILFQLMPLSFHPNNIYAV